MRDPTERFTERARDYARHRPPYPPEAYDALLRGLDAKVAADLGAGTGISTRPLLERGLKVHAVEPNAAMRAQAPDLDWIDARAEETGLPDGSVDLVIAGQAFHWFDSDVALAEIKRILRPGGRVGLLWNLPDPDDPVGGAYDRILLEVRDPCAVDRRRALGVPLLESPLFTGAKRLRFRHAMEMTPDALLGRAVSSSYFPKSGPVHDRLVAKLRALAPGPVRFGHETLLWLATRGG